MRNDLQLAQFLECSQGGFLLSPSVVLVPPSLEAEENVYTSILVALRAPRNQRLVCLDLFDVWFLFPLHVNLCSKVVPDDADTSGCVFLLSDGLVDDLNNLLRVFAVVKCILDDRIYIWASLQPFDVKLFQERIELRRCLFALQGFQGVVFVVFNQLFDGSFAFFTIATFDFELGKHHGELASSLALRKCEFEEKGFDLVEHDCVLLQTFSD
mmetsp:Transcript_7230/g.14071  ORF Transcript_7230/g.14071 Transcript_7230/m.14071 type:complete len:212 (+) Transcript_7230:423-1058(+)